ncbi:DUF6318 family protein [Paenarthrobacter sp. NPDC092416]|uniref:DUF6318 family protein n=1 Tax=Paenarthrobacter sp. NPDC092416 TaxID=3364386 RepID=UPI00381E2644
MSRFLFAFSPAFSGPVRAPIAVLFAALALLLSGCQGGIAPSNSPTETGSTTASPSTSATPSTAPTSMLPAVYKPADANGKAQNVPVPVMPELAKENTKEGLEAFVRYYYAVKNYANETGDIGTLETLTSPQCLACSNLQKATADSYVDGRWMVGGKMELPVIEMDWKQADDSHAVKYQLIQQTITYHNADGTQGRPPSEASNSAFVLVGHFDTAWKVVEIGVLR